MVVILLNYVIAAVPDHAGNGNRGQNLNYRVIDGVGHDGVFKRLHVNLVDFGKLPVSALLAVEKLQNRHSADMFLQIGIDAGDGHANAAVGVANFVAEHFCSDRNERQHGEGDQRQPPVHFQHDDENAGEHEDVFEDRHHAGGKHIVQGVHVGGDAGDQAAYRVLVVESDVHALQVAEDLAAQVKHDFLAGPLHEVGLQEVEEKSEDQHAYVDGGDLRDAGQRPGAQPVPERGS